MALRPTRLTSAPRSVSRCAIKIWVPAAAKYSAVAPSRLRASIGAPRASSRSTILGWPDFAAWLSGRAPNRSRASTDAPWSSSFAARSRQLPSTAENSVNDTSIALICGLAISNRRDNPWHRSESAARAIDAVLNRAIAMMQRRTAERCKAVSPRAVCCFGHQAGTAGAQSQGGERFQQESLQNMTLKVRYRQILTSQPSIETYLQHGRYGSLAPFRPPAEHFRSRSVNSHTV